MSNRVFKTCMVGGLTTQASNRFQYILTRTEKGIDSSSKTAFPLQYSAGLLSQRR